MFKLYNNNICSVQDVKQSFFLLVYMQKVRGIDNKKAYNELLERECYSQNREKVEISPINILADVLLRDRVYREFLNMLNNIDLI